MTVQGFVQSLLAGLGVVDPVDVFVEVSVVVVVLQGQVVATDPANVEVAKAEDLKYSGAANVPGVILFFNFKDYIPVAVYEARQCPIAFGIPMQVQSILAR